MWFASSITGWFPFYAFLIILLIIKFKKKTWLIMVLIIPLILTSDTLSSSILKPLIHRLRPGHHPALENLLHYVNHYRGGLYSFPSSHATNFFCLGHLSLASNCNEFKVAWLLAFPGCIIRIL